MVLDALLADRGEAVTTKLHEEATALRAELRSGTLEPTNVRLGEWVAANLDAIITVLESGGFRASPATERGSDSDAGLASDSSGLAAAASFGALLNDAEQGQLADWTMNLGGFVQRIAALDPRRGPIDTNQMVADAKRLLKEGGLDV